MKILVQRVLSASVEVEKKIVGKIGHGLLLYVGFTRQLLVPKGTSLPVADARASAHIDWCAPPRRTAKRDKILREALRSAQSL